LQGVVRGPLVRQPLYARRGRRLGPPGVLFRRRRRPAAQRVPAGHRELPMTSLTTVGAAKTLASDLEHLALFREAAEGEAVADGLVGDGLEQDLGDRLEIAAVAQRGADVHLVVVQ